MNIPKVSSVVKKILLEHPLTRDSDELLILNVWATQEPKLRDNSYRFIDFAKDFMNCQYYSTESIGRARRKIQEEFPQYRGDNYKTRQRHQQDVKDQLKQPEMLSGGTP